MNWVPRPLSVPGGGRAQRQHRQDHDIGHNEHPPRPPSALRYPGRADASRDRLVSRASAAEGTVNVHVPTMLSPYRARIGFRQWLGAPSKSPRARFPASWVAVGPTWVRDPRHGTPRHRIRGEQRLLPVKKGAALAAPGDVRLTPVQPHPRRPVGRGGPARANGGTSNTCPNQPERCNENHLLLAAPASCRA